MIKGRVRLLPEVFFYFLLQVKFLFFAINKKNKKKTDIIKFFFEAVNYFRFYYY